MIRIWYRYETYLQLQQNYDDDNEDPDAGGGFFLIFSAALPLTLSAILSAPGLILVRISWM
jgi:hypothetical protein